MSQIPGDAYVMIIGAMKCGTSSLYEYLREHPEICPCIRKEPEFFSAHQSHRYNGVTNYEELWNFDPIRHRYALEASTGYTKYPGEPNVPRKIHSYGLRPKLIYLVRNPFERIRSHYEHLVARHADFDRATPFTWDEFIDTSNYFLQLEQYRQYFPRESLLLLDFEELRDNPRECLKKVCTFLNISDHFPRSTFEVHHRSLSRAEALVAKSPGLRAASRVVPKSGRRLAKRLLRRVFKPRELGLEDRKVVLERLREDMGRFHKEYGFDVSKWGWV